MKWYADGYQVTLHVEQKEARRLLSVVIVGASGPPPTGGWPLRFCCPPHPVLLGPAGYSPLDAPQRNVELRQRVLKGAVSPKQLVSMDSRELATQQQREEYTRLQERETRRVTLAGHGSSATSEYQCERCRGRSCDYLDSGRRDIGKCETWGSKDCQGASRLVICLGCGHRWEVDDV
ncbi:hypothetical protein Vafri_21025 [Volvox africanus]|uniref:TFIIS central domain-containing protein n=1 Tax=Volvox africanus TaxID=51714 RepID=A0A8J4BR83_9CHLO|nr:hypothetical protein Vafri_21025 [Volvox africanus]